MWKLDLEDEYYKIYDRDKQIAGYFDPDFGEIFPKDKEYEIIQEMLKNHDKISGGFLTVPMVKFGIFNSELDLDIQGLKKQLKLVNNRVGKWTNYISSTNRHLHFIRVSHTDQDMLSITFPIKFSRPTALEKRDILKEIETILDLLQKQNLL